MKFSLLCLSFLLANVALGQSFDVPLVMRPYGFDGRATLDYFTSEKNFLENGDEINLGGSRGYTNYTTEVEGLFSPSPTWVVGGGAHIGYAESYGYTNDRTNSEVSDLYFRGMKAFNFSMLTLIPEVQYLATLARIDETSDSALVAEGANQATIGTWAVFHISKIRFYGFAGYRDRDEGRSALLPWRLGAILSFPEFWLGLDSRGYQSIRDDQYTNTPATRELYPVTVNAGSLRYNSVNPDLAEIGAFAGFRLSPSFRVEGGARTAIAGHNTASGLTLFASFAYAMGEGIQTKELTDEATKLEKDLRQNTKKPKSREKFELILEDYDETLFETVD